MLAVHILLGPCTDSCFSLVYRDAEGTEFCQECSPLAGSNAYVCALNTCCATAEKKVLQEGQAELEQQQAQAAAQLKAQQEAAAGSKKKVDEAEKALSERQKLQAKAEADVAKLRAELTESMLLFTSLLLPAPSSFTGPRNQADDLPTVSSPEHQCSVLLRVCCR